jgi:hypothetical protein
MIEQTLEPTTTTTIAFTAVSTTGVSVWGYQTAQVSAVNTIKADVMKAETPVYDLTGRCIRSIDRKGIYIQNGRKLLAH